MDRTLEILTPQLQVYIIAAISMAETPSHFSEFDAAAAGEALGAEPHPLRDVAHGDGEALRVGDTAVEVYPDAGITRVTTPDARIELYRVPRYSVSGERVVFEQGDQDERTRLLVRRDGKVSFFPVLRAAESPTTRDPASHGAQVTIAPPAPSEGSTAGSDSTSADPEGQEFPAVQLTGRLGRDPWFNSQGEQSISGFPLAVNDETSGNTTWHRVVVFGEQADTLHEAHRTGQIRKGRTVEVTGQHVVREEPTKAGGVRKVDEFHASAVRRLTTTSRRPR